jgi:hypothetical protein
MKAIVTLKLTPKQLKQLEPLYEKVLEGYHASDLPTDDHRGMIIAQVWPDRKKIKCNFVSHEQTIRLNKEAKRFSNALEKYAGLSK